MSVKYVMANIKLPIAITEKTSTPMFEYMDVVIEKLSELPPAPDAKKVPIMEKIKAVIQRDKERDKDPEPEPVLTISKDEIQKPRDRTRNNMSFKNRYSKTNRYSMKSRNNISIVDSATSSNDKDVGLSVPPEAQVDKQEDDQSHSNSEEVVNPESESA